MWPLLISVVSVKVPVTSKAHPGKIIVCASITSGGKLPLIIMDSKVKINTQIYLEDALKKHLIPFLSFYSGEKLYLFQQDGALLTGWILQESCRDTLSDIIATEDWLTNSSDLNH